jgi:Nucleoside-diphosphate-sugar epimerases
LKTARFENLIEVEHKIKIVKGNLNDSENLSTIFENAKIDIVINLVTTLLPNSVGDEAREEIKKNIELNEKLLNMMNSYEVKKIIYFSSGGTVYGDNGKTRNSENSKTVPINLYGWLKLSIENLIITYSKMTEVEYLIIRPSNPFGKYQNIRGKQGLISVILGKILDDEYIEIWGKGDIIRDYIYIDDLCNGVVNLLMSNKWNEIYNIGSGKGYSVNQIIKICEDITDKKLKIIYKDARKVDVKKNILDIKKIKTECNFIVNTSVKDGIKKTFEFLK